MALSTVTVASLNPRMPRARRRSFYTPRYLVELSFGQGFALIWHDHMMAGLLGDPDVSSSSLNHEPNRGKV